MDTLAIWPTLRRSSGPQRSSKLTLFCSRKLIHHQSQFLRAPTVFFASERGQGRAALFAARRSKPLTPWRGEYAGEWLCAQQFRAHNHDDKALIPRSRVGQVYERKGGQFPRASRSGSKNSSMRCRCLSPKAAKTFDISPQSSRLVRPRWLLIICLQRAPIHR